MHTQVCVWEWEWEKLLKGSLIPIWTVGLWKVLGFFFPLSFCLWMLCRNSPLNATLIFFNLCPSIDSRRYTSPKNLHSWHCDSSSTKLQFIGAGYFPKYRADPTAPENCRTLPYASFYIKKVVYKRLWSKSQKAAFLMTWVKTRNDLFIFLSD